MFLNSRESLANSPSGINPSSVKTIEWDWAFGLQFPPYNEQLSSEPIGNAIITHTQGRHHFFPRDEWPGTYYFPVTEIHPVDEEAVARGPHVVVISGIHREEAALCAVNTMAHRLVRGLEENSLHMTGGRLTLLRQVNSYAMEGHGDGRKTLDGIDLNALGKDLTQYRYSHPYAVALAEQISGYAEAGHDGESTYVIDVHGSGEGRNQMQHVILPASMPAGMIGLLMGLGLPVVIRQVGKEGMIGKTMLMCERIPAGGRGIAWEVDKNSPEDAANRIIYFLGLIGMFEGTENVVTPEELHPFHPNPPVIYYDRQVIPFTGIRAQLVALGADLGEKCPKGEPVATFVDLADGQRKTVVCNTDVMIVGASDPRCIVPETENLLRVAALPFSADVQYEVMIAEESNRFNENS